MAGIDPKWLEILKAGGWERLAIAVGCGAVFALVKAGVLQSPGALALFIVAAVGILCACLTVAAMLRALFKFVPPSVWIKHWVTQARQRREVAAYIPHMTDEDRAIIGYLLAHNQKSFTGASDGGHATTLISRGVIVLALRKGQIFVENDTPFMVPDHIWAVLVRHKDKFPTPGPGDPHPWRVHWMAR